MTSTQHEETTNCTNFNLLVKAALESSEHNDNVLIQENSRKCDHGDEIKLLCNVRLRNVKFVINAADVDVTMMVYQLLKK